MHVEVVEGEEGVRFCTPFRRDFLVELKRTIPSGWRRWDDHFRFWTVFRPYDDKALQLIGKFFGEGAPSPSASAASHQSAYDTLFVQPGAPKAVIRAAYRALAKVHHPDRGGDAEIMRRINAAADALEVAA